MNDRRTFLKETGALTVLAPLIAVSPRSSQAASRGAPHPGNKPSSKNSPSTANSEERPTNVVFILTDDQGAWAAGCYGNPEIRTPNLDALAAGGARFRNAFAASPVCSPSRATFLTGRIPSQHGIHEWLRDEEWGVHANPLLANEVTFSEILAHHGYTLGISGKWHVGDSLHRQKGFSFWSVIPHGSSTNNNALMVIDGQLEKTSGYVTEVITDRALEFIKADHDRPFFLCVNYTAPHEPYEGHPERYVDLYRHCLFKSIPREGIHPWAIKATAKYIGDPDKLAKYFAAVTAMDENVGRIMRTLGDLGLTDRTLVIFASDQGYMAGHHGLWAKGNASEPKNLFDDSLRIPLIFHHPGRIPPGQVIDIAVAGYDFFPTLLDYLGVAHQGRNLPGRSYAAAVKGRGISWNNVVYAEYGLVRAIRTEQWKYVRRHPSGPDEFYDLQHDPGERRNLVWEADKAETVKDLRARLEEWFNHFVEPEKDPVRDGRDPTFISERLYPFR